MGKEGRSWRKWVKRRLGSLSIQGEFADQLLIQHSRELDALKVRGVAPALTDSKESRVRLDSLAEGAVRMDCVLGQVRDSVDGLVEKVLAVERLTTRVEYLESTLYTTPAQEVEPPDWATALRGEIWGVQKKLTEQMVELRGELAKAATQEQLNDAYQSLSDAGTEQVTWLGALHDKVMGLMRAKEFGKTGDYGESTARLDEEATTIRAFKDAVNEIAASRTPPAWGGVKYSLFRTFDAATRLVNQVPDRDHWAGHQPDAERVFSHLLEEAMKVSQWAAIAQSDYEKERGIDSPSDTLKAAAEDAARIAEEVARIMEARLGDPWETRKTMAPLLTATRALKTAIVYGAGVHYNPTKE